MASKLRWFARITCSMSNIFSCCCWNIGIIACGFHILAICSGSKACMISRMSKLLLLFATLVLSLGRPQPMGVAGMGGLGRRRRRLVHHREPVRRTRPAGRRHPAAEVPRLRQRLRAGQAALALVRRPRAARPAALGPRSRPAARLDEAVSRGSGCGRSADRSIAGGGSSAADAPLALVMTYPHYLFLRDLVRPDLLVYFNLDDYSLYWPSRPIEVRRPGTQLVARGRPDGLRRPGPRRAAPRRRSRRPPATIRHLPHGTPTALPRLGGRRPARPGAGRPGGPAAPAARLRRRRSKTGWTGRCSTASADAVPRGVDRARRPPCRRPRDGAWRDDAGAAWPPERPRDRLAAAGRRLGAYNRAFDVCLIPYRADHPFNRACCPTKIMDYMGSGRPIVVDRPARVPALRRPVRRRRRRRRLRRRVGLARLAGLRRRPRPCPARLGRANILPSASPSG